ncbi:MAG: CGLD27 family protein [Scytolyngbya sp. HA4215-MV1]|jgi:hypothetical protein|nr:CGLD27 family protein [Scytolyngbya sp. HA4215-MV1]
MNSSTFVCPVPVEQRPINEYQDLKSSWFFGWATLDRKRYVMPMVWIWGFSWIVMGPVAAVSFPPDKDLGHFLLSGAAGASLLLALVLLRLYLGWVYVCDRLLDANVFYEESGWYDGQTWTKPPEVLMQDQLIVSHQIKPIFSRLRYTFGVLSLCFVCGILLWNFV